MDTAKFLSMVLGDEGFYCLVSIKEGRTVQKFYVTQASLIEAANQGDSTGCDVYFALSTFVTDKTRKANNISQVKSLFLDLDCGPGKPYPTQKDAVVALQSFCKTCALPTPSAIVNSGRGIHVYWVLSKPHTREQWLPVAEGLKAACAAHGLHADPTVTADAARILRIPNTHNYKGTPPLNVKVLRGTDSTVDLSGFAEKLGALDIAVAPSLPQREFSDQDKKDMEAVLGSHTKKFGRLITLTGNGRGCNQINRALLEPNTLSYGDWTHALSIAKHCEEAPVAIHIVSKGYTGYSPEETEKVAASLEVPHLCVTFEKDNPAGCEGCPHKGKIRSPIKLCMEVREATPEENVVQVPAKPKKATPPAEVVPGGGGGTLFADQDQDQDPAQRMLSYTIPPFPFPYIRPSGGGVWKRVKNKDGDVEEERIWPTDLYLVSRMEDPTLGPCFLFRHHTKRDGVKDFVIQGVKLTSRDKFREAMGMNDIHLIEGMPLMKYINRWVEELQSTQDEILVKAQFGWTEDHKSFVLGDREIFADRIIDNPPSARTAQYFPHFAKKGTLEGWKGVTAFYNRPNMEEHQYMFGLSFGSPLMEFVPNIAGAIYHVMSAESGFGKTTGQWGGASVWGNHKKLVLKGKDTGNSVWNRAEAFKNIVLYIDELSNYPAKDASDFAYAISDGEQKNRMSNAGLNAERYRGVEWSLLCGTSANMSLLEKMTELRTLPKGEAQRVMEATVRQQILSPEDNLKAQTLNDDLEANYGHAGEIYIQHVLQNLPAVQKLLKETIASIIKDAGLTSQNRFWTAQTGATLTGLTIAKHLGLLDFDLEAMRKWIIDKLMRLVLNMQDMDIDISDLVGAFYSDNTRSILRVASNQNPEADELQEQLLHADAMPMYKWVGRHEYDVGKFYVLPAPFKKWCVQQGYHYSAISELIIAQLQGKRIKMRLGRGTHLGLGPQHVLEMAWDADSHTDTSTAHTAAASTGLYDADKAN